MSYIEKIYNQNPWFKNSSLIDDDIYIKKLKNVKYVWEKTDFLECVFNDGIYIITGPRQIGKTTHLKLFIQRNINKTNNKNFLYFNCDLLDNKQDIADLINEYIQQVADRKSRIYILLDELTSVKDGVLGVKYLVDSGLIDNITYILTGSVTANIRKTGEYLPGRRGKGKDFVFAPLNFSDYIYLKYPEIKSVIKQVNYNNIQVKYMDIKNILNLEKEFENYIICGGIPKVINDYILNKEIPDDTFELYRNWIVSEIAKNEKKEYIVKIIFERVLNSLSSDISYNSFLQDTALGSHNTVYDYIEFLQDCYILSQVNNYDFSQKKINYRKNKKIYFNDIYIYWVIDKWIHAKTKQDYFDIKDTRLKSRLIENIIYNSLSGFKKVYFYRNTEEIDFILPDNNTAIEVKYTSKIVPEDYKCLNKFPGKKIVVSKSTLQSNDKISIIPAYLFALINNRVL